MAAAKPGGGEHRSFLCVGCRTWRVEIQSIDDLIPLPDLQDLRPTAKLWATFFLPLNRWTVHLYVWIY